MRVSSENYQYSVPIKADSAESVTIRQTAQGAQKPHDGHAPSSQDSVEISSLAEKLAHADMKEQAALARIALLKQHNATLTGTEEQEKRAAAEDPLEMFTRVMFSMMQERMELWEENAAEQAEQQKREMAEAITELESAREEKRAVQEEVTTATATPRVSTPIASLEGASNAAVKTEPSEPSEQTESGKLSRRDKHYPL